MKELGVGRTSASSESKPMEVEETTAVENELEMTSDEFALLRRSVSNETTQLYIISVVYIVILLLLIICQFVTLQR